MKKKLIAVSAIAAAALTLGSVTSAAAYDGRGDRGEKLNSILGGLVSKGTLTQTQVDSITKALGDARSAMKAIHEAERAAHQKVITDTLGISAETLTSRLKAGESLATIAGAKKADLIAALVAYHTKKIDAAVTSGKLTAERAASMKSNLTDHVTKMVEGLKGPHKGHPGKGFMHGKKHGKGPRG